MLGAPQTHNPLTPARRAAFWPYALLTVLVLVPLSAWLSAYFWVNSTPGRAAVADWLLGRVPPGRLVLGDLHWGPSPGRLQLISVALVDPSGRPLIDATEIDADVDVPALLAGDLVADRVRASAFTLHLAWDAEGALNLTRALARTPRPGAPASTPGHRRRVELRRIELDQGTVTLEWPRWGLHFDHVQARGAVSAGAAPLVIQADLRAAASHAMWGDGDRAVRVRGVDIAGFRWSSDGFDVDRLALAGTDGSWVDVAGSLDLSGDLALDVRGDAALGPDVAAMTAGAVLPDGARAEDVRVSLVGTAVTGRAGRLEAPTLVLGPITAHGVVAPLDELTYVPGLLKPTGAITVYDARIATLDAPGLSVRDTTIGSLKVALAAKSSAVLEDVAAGALVVEDRLTTRARGRVEASFGLTSGTLEATADTDGGRLAASATVRVSPLTKKVKVSLRVALEHVAGAVASYLTSYLPAAEAASLTPPLDGFALFETTIGKEKGEQGQGKRWAAHTALAEASLEGGRGRVTFDGDAWAALPPVEVPTP